ncbi:MAG: HlyD family type I secretion periplasmic adaptor subunit [Hyphomicrobiaceae bacterium]
MQSESKPAVVATKPVSQPVAASGDREFLPAALEILETPPSPIRIWLLWFICGAFATAIIWAYFGKLDIHAVAHGKIQPTGRSKVVQPLEAGKVRAIRIENGSRVKAGDVLLELDPTDTMADRSAFERELEALTAEIARRRVGIAAAGLESPKPSPIPFPGKIDEVVRLREAKVLEAELSELASGVESLRAQRREKAAVKQRLDMSIQARERLIAVLKQRVDMRKQVLEKGAGTRSALIDALQDYEKEATLVANERGQLLETAAAIDSIEKRLRELVSRFVSDQSQKLAEADRRRDRITQELVKARSRYDRTVLKSPIDGTVQQLAVTTIGQVVASGQTLMAIVPEDSPIEVEAMVENKDIGFVKPEQEAIVKIDAFPFTRYGTITGKVVRVSKDAVEDRAASGLSDPVGATNPRASAPQSTTGRGQNLVFPATIQLSKRVMRVDGVDIPLSPGMSVSVEITTGKRRAIDYLLAPLREIAAGTGHER